MVGYQPKFVHGRSLRKLWETPLRERSRPAIGKNADRIQWQCYM